jgi:hypothetical protein
VPIAAMPLPAGRRRRIARSGELPFDFLGHLQMPLHHQDPFRALSLPISTSDCPSRATLLDKAGIPGSLAAFRKRGHGGHGHERDADKHALH